MNVLAPIRPTVLQQCRIRLSAGPAAVAEARRHVRAAICVGDVLVDQDVAVLLTSELVTNAIRHDAGEIITIAVTYCFRQLRVDVHDTSRCLPVVAAAPSDAEAGRGLMLVAALSAEWGFYRTPAGKAVYFTLAYGPMWPGAADVARRAFRRGDCEPLPLPAGLQSPPARRDPRGLFTSTRGYAAPIRARYRSANGRRACSGCGRRGSPQSTGTAAAWRRSPGWTALPPQRRRS
jgi:anti-sigma regulatory factor (Ser/Thr protein kinase)